MTNQAVAASVANHFAIPGAGRTEHVLGVTVIHKAEPAQSGGLLCAEIVVPPGQGIPPHRHAGEDEAFYVLHGSVVIEGDDCGSDGTQLAPGSFFFGPRGNVHGFRCDGTEPAKLLVFITPGTSIGAMFTDLAGLSGQEDHTDPGQIATICGRYGITFGRG